MKVYREVQTEMLNLKGEDDKIQEDVRMHVGNSWNEFPALLNISALQAGRCSNHLRLHCRNYGEEQIQVTFAPTMH